MFNSLEVILRSNDVVGSFVVDVGMDRLNVADLFAYASAIELSFTSICRKQKNMINKDIES